MSAQPSSADAASMARFLSAIQKEVAGLGSKINEDMTLKFAQQEAALIHKASRIDAFQFL